MKKRETHGFRSEIKQILHLMIHSLYSNREIFLRELISNASDAVEKMRFRILSNPNLYENSELHIRISCDKKKRILTIADNGIGMNRDEVINYLGTIAKSGTKDFLKFLDSNQEKSNQLIGQFGVGFYSAFIVANRVVVRTRTVCNNTENGVLWESHGDGEYAISDIKKEDRGTEVTLYLREGEEDFLNEWCIRSIINKYSDHIAVPIEIEKKEKRIDETVMRWERINEAQALWTRNRSEIKDDEYNEFYKKITNDPANPLAWNHSRVEGKHECISLIYIPSQAPGDIWNCNQKHGLKVYARRVLIMDNAEKFVPNYLRFIRGLIDSSNLPLNISREVLQDSKVGHNLKNILTRRTLQMLAKLEKNNKEKYQIFWKEFGLVLKEGLSEDPANKEEIAKLLRFSSTYINSSEQTVSLIEYISRMKEWQKKIYYITADSYAAARNSPHLEVLCKKEIEVLLLFDRIDEWIMSCLKEFDGKLFQSVSKVDETIEKLTEKEKDIDKNKNIEMEETLKSFIERVRNLLGGRVKEVRFTHRLINTPAVVTTNVNEMSTQMAKLLISSGQVTPEVKYIFEMNPDHLLIKRVMDIKDDDLFKEWIELLLDQSLLAECGSLEDPNLFIKRINTFLMR